MSGSEINLGAVFLRSVFPLTAVLAPGSVQRLIAMSGAVAAAGLLLGVMVFRDGTPSRSPRRGWARNCIIGALCLAVVSGCAAGTADIPVTYFEDFSGARTPFLAEGMVGDGRIDMHLIPGRCRQIAAQGGLPPKVVSEYPCRQSVVNVQVVIEIDGLGAFRSVTDGYGAVSLVVLDMAAAALDDGARVYFFVGNQAIGEALAAPLIATARSRLDREEMAELPPPPPPAPPAPAPSQEFPAPTPLPVAPPRVDQPIDPLTNAVTAVAVCAVKQWGMARCKEFVADDIGLGSDAGAGLCGAAKKVMEKGDAATLDDMIEAGAKSIVKSRVGQSSDFIKVMLKAADLYSCASPQIDRLVQSLLVNPN